MNSSFNIAGARDLLHHISEESTNGLSLSSLMQNTQWSNGVTVNRIENPTTWRLLRGNNGAQEELVFTVRGIIVSKELPPILQRPRLSQGRFKYLRQSVAIAGFGTPKFDQAIASASEIYGAFDRHFADGQMESWSASGSSEHGEFATLDVSNRYMVPRREVPSVPHQPFGTSVDPKGILERMAAESDHVHTEENEVVYFTGRMLESGTRTFENAPPQTFRIGDVVEIQLTFVVVPLKGERYKMVSVLHSIALLDASFGQSVSKNNTVRKTSDATARTITSVKHHVGYGPTDAPANDQGEGPKRGRMEAEDAANKLVAGSNTQLNL